MMQQSKVVVQRRRKKIGKQSRGRVTASVTIVLVIGRSSDGRIQTIKKGRSPLLEVCGTLWPASSTPSSACCAALASAAPHAAAALVWHWPNLNVS